MARFQDEFVSQTLDEDTWFTYIKGEDRIFPDKPWSYVVPRGDGDVPHDVSDYTFTAVAKFFDSVQFQVGLDGSMTIKRIVPSTTRQNMTLDTANGGREGTFAAVFPSNIWTGDVPFNTKTPPAIGVWLTAVPPVADRSFADVPESWTERLLVIVRASAED